MADDIPVTFEGRKIGRVRQWAVVDGGIEFTAEIDSEYGLLIGTINPGSISIDNNEENTT